MGKIDHADDAEHHRVADRDQTVYRAERDAVDELLGEIVHASKALARPEEFLTAGAWSGNAAGAPVTALRTVSVPACAIIARQGLSCPFGGCGLGVAAGSRREAHG